MATRPDHVRVGIVGGEMDARLAEDLEPNAARLKMYADMFQDMELVTSANRRWTTGTATREHGDGGRFHAL